MKEALKQWLRSYGVTKQHLNFPQYYVPYLMVAAAPSSRSRSRSSSRSVAT